MPDTHTPGPWEVESGTTLIWGSCSEHALGYPVAEAHQLLGHGSPFRREARYDEAKANARLIAAAPDLLDAAKEALEVAESWIHDQLDGTIGLDSALEELQSVRDVIAKAEGK